MSKAKIDILAITSQFDIYGHKTFSIIYALQRVVWIVKIIKFDLYLNLFSNFQIFCTFFIVCYAAPLQVRHTKLVVRLAGLVFRYLLE